MPNIRLLLPSTNMLERQFSKTQQEAGIDEAGRGCIAGPVVAAAVILPPDFQHEFLNDSKQISEKKRDILREIIEKEALAWAVGIISPERIDQINILNATYEAMHQAVEKLAISPSFLAIDGNRFRAYQNIAHECIIKGDGKYMNIAAASILAKTHRDQEMKRLSQLFPAYDWAQNKGYPTKAHKQAVLTHGLSPHHRRSFNCYPPLKLF